MSFNDDEPIIVAVDNSGKPAPPEIGKVKFTTQSKKFAPLGVTDFTALLNFTGQNSASDRPGVDVIAVLDVSGSMEGEKLDKLKTAMLFFIRKLGSTDRVSIVSFDSVGQRLCRLRQINNNSQSEIEMIVKNLVANGGTNITSGLQIALRVLNDRTISLGRKGAVMLMSDGAQNEGGDARQVVLPNVPVHTFGFGDDYDSAVLNGIANNSKDGTFSFADVNDLSKVFSQCLGGLLTIVVDDFKVTITPVANRAGDKPAIQDVLAGNYMQTKDANTGSVTVSFGSLYAKEIRKILVKLLLPKVASRTTTLFKVSFEYKKGATVVPGAPKTITITRDGKISNEPEPEDIVTEEARLGATRMMTEARVLADNKNLTDAKEKLVNAHSMLDDVEVQDEINQQTLEALKLEVQTLKKFMRNPEIYNAIGRAFALASETSHNRQRFASRGDDENLRMFATPRMDEYLKQAKAYEEDESIPIPSADQDVAEETAKDPLGPIAGALGDYLQAAIEALKGIQDILNNATI